MAAGGSDWLTHSQHTISSATATQNFTEPYRSGLQICEISWPYGLPNWGAQKQILGPTKFEKVVNNPLNEEIQFHINF